MRDHCGGIILYLGCFGGYRNTYATQCHRTLHKHCTNVSFLILMLTCTWRLTGTESACQCRRCRFNPWFRKIPWRRKWKPTPEFLPGESHGQRSLAARVYGVTRVGYDLATKLPTPREHFMQRWAQ